MVGMEEYINDVLAPKLRGDGGWVEFVSQEGETLNLVFRAECSKCIILDRCCKWIESEIARDLETKVTVSATRMKPYFWQTV